MKMLKLIFKYILLWFIGGSIYYLIEIIYRGYSHWTMFILGGICFISLGLINELFSWETPLWKQCIVGSIIITLLEFVTGCIVNLVLSWSVWDYSSLPLNILGQISIPFSLVWCGLSIIGIVLDDYFRYWFFKEEKPRYKLF